MDRSRELILVLLAFGIGMILEHLSGMVGKLKLIVERNSLDRHARMLNADYNLTFNLGKAADLDEMYNVQQIYGSVVDRVGDVLRENLPDLTLQLPKGEVCAKVKLSVMLVDSGGRNILDLQN